RQQTVTRSRGLLFGIAVELRIRPVGVVFVIVVAAGGGDEAKLLYTCNVDVQQFGAVGSRQPPAGGQEDAVAPDLEDSRAVGTAVANVVVNTHLSGEARVLP